MALISGADHYSMTVQDLDRAVEFYSSNFDLELVHEAETESGDPTSQTFTDLTGLDDVEHRSAYLEIEAGVVLELFEYANPTGEDLETAQPNDVGSSHFCFATDDIQDLYTRLEDDVEFLSEPVEFPSGVEAVFFRDPEGNLMEVLARPDS